MAKSLLKSAILKFGDCIARYPSGAKLVQYAKLSLYLKAMGWFKSVGQKKPINKKSEPLPWITYASLHFLKDRIQPSMDVFEWGSGNSTLWWSNRVASVTSCEHSETWFENMKNKLPNNVNYHHVDLEEDGDYARFALQFENKFDIIVIDGRDRVNCSTKCIHALKDDGVIIWDNSDRRHYRDGYAYLIENGFKRLDFQSLGPINFTDWCTSVFYRDKNCLGL